MRTVRARAGCPACQCRLQLAALPYPVSAYGQEVALPGGVEKDVRIWMYVPSEGSYVGQVQLLSASGQVLAESAAQGQAARADIPLLGTLADSSTLAAQLGRIEVPYQQGLNAQVRTIEIAATDMPPRAEYLQAFRGLVVQGSAASSLTVRAAASSSGLGRPGRSSAHRRGSGRQPCRERARRLERAADALRQRGWRD